MTEELTISGEKALYHICDDLTAYQESLQMLEAQIAAGLPDEERGEIEQQRNEVRARIEEISGDLARKTDGVAIVLRRMDLEFDYINAERKRLKAKEEAIEQAKNNLRTYVLRTMQKNGIKTLKTPSNTLCIGSTTAVEITDPTLVPPQFLNAEVKLPYSLWQEILVVVGKFGTLGQDVQALRVKTESSASMIKKAIKAGEDVPGADLAINSHLICR